MKSDIEIARSVRLSPITDIGAKLDIPRDALIPYGWEIGKVAPTTSRAWETARTAS